MNTTTGTDAARRPALRRGASGAAVRELQKALAAAGLTLEADGIFGPATESALKHFQARHGLSVDGIAGPGTWQQLGAAPARALSAAGAEFIAGFEGFRATLYDDAAGHCTIGFGHLVHQGRCNGSEPEALRAGVSRERALELLIEDAAVAAAEVERSVRVALSQPQFDALVSFTFNVGTGALRGSTLVTELNRGRYEAVPAQLARWVNAGGRPLPGLVRRRAAEAALFRDGTY